MEKLKLNIHPPNKTTPSMKETLKTDNLDCAAYLMASGFECSIKRKGLHKCTFTLRGGKRLFELHEKFLKGKCEVNITHYLYTRGTLKRLASYEALPMPHVNGEKPTIKPGEAYWYISNGVVSHALFGNNPVHQQRLKDGNAYSSKEEAEKHL